MEALAHGVSRYGDTPADNAHLPVAAAGVLTVMVSLVIAVVVGLQTADLWAQDAAARTVDLQTQGTIAAISVWNPALVLAGVSLLMTAVAVVLQRVVKTIRRRGEAMHQSLPVLLHGRGV